MFGGYAEIAPYYYDNPSVDTGVPHEYLPQTNDLDPWNLNSTCPRDFIMIAEFSEQEGPKPLITIPHNSSGNLDLNDFAVRIMSVDFQTVSSGTFTLTEDSQVVMTENKHNIVSYIHHFTLYDSQARGFVRPFCMAYVTSEHRKVMTFYDDLKKEFERVSRLFRHGNLSLFVQDMTYFRSDLQFTKERFSEYHAMKDSGHEMSDTDWPIHGEEDTILSTSTSHGIDNMLTEVSNILHTTSNMLNDHEMECPLNKQSTTCREKEVDEMEGLSLKEFHFSNSLSENAVDIGKSESCSDLDTMTREDIVYKPKVVRTTNKRKFDKELRSIHELCQFGAKEGLNRLRSIHKYFSREMVILEIEKQDCRVTEPSVGLLTVGRSVQNNFMADLNLNPFLNLHSKSSDSLLSGKWSYDDCDDSGSYKSAESFLSCQDDVTPTQSSAPPFVMAGIFVEEKGSLSSYDVTSVTADDTTSDTLSWQSSQPESGGEDRMLSDFAAHHRKQEPSIPYAFHEGIPPSIFSSAHQINSLDTASPGFGVHRFALQYPFCPHIMFSLLTGRAVVLVGDRKYESEIISLVNALSLFVPGHNRHSVIPWHTRPLKLLDLSHMKLVGVLRRERKTTESVIPTSLQKYVSVFDVEKRTLKATAYLGGFITDIHNKARSFVCDQSFISYIQCVLHSLSTRAYVYFYTFYLRLQDLDSNALSIQTRDVMESKQDEFFTRLKVNSQDAMIVKYLSEVVEQQQLEEIDGAQNGENTTIKLCLKHQKLCMF